MEELYWITRLDGINALFCVLAAGTGLVGLVMFACSIDDDSDCAQGIRKILKRYFIPIFVIGILGCIFVPRTKEALIIYGVGGTIDYVKQDSTARQLPHKTIIALDKFLDTITEDKDNQNK